MKLLSIVNRVTKCLLCTHQSFKSVVLTGKKIIKKLATLKLPQSSMKIPSYFAFDQPESEKANKLNTKHFVLMIE